VLGIVVLGPASRLLRRRAALFVQAHLLSHGVHGLLMHASEG
jgi:hypothetical protein